MATAYTSLLGLALPVTGDLSGTWGNAVNTEITALLDSAVAGTTSITVDADITLTTTTGAANTSRQAIILWNPATGTTTRNITAPAQSKVYVVINASGGTQSIVLRGAGPTTGVTIAQGEKAVCAWNGTDFIKISSAFTGATTGTGALVFATSPTLVTPALGTPASGTVTNLTGTASININGTVGATTASTGAFTTLTTSSTVTHNGGTANGVAFLNASKVLTTGSALTFDGTMLVNAVSSAASGLLLTLQNTSTGSFMQFAQPGVANLLFGCPNADAFTWRTFGSGTYPEQMRLTATGLGIGTSSPGAKLDVNGGALIQGLTVGRGAGAVSTNTAVGASALAANTTGSFSTAIGAGALAAQNGTAGVQNVAVGNDAAGKLTTGTQNTAVGISTLGWGAAVATTGTFNATYGQGSLYLLTSGSYNTALGAQSLFSNTTASNNTAVGYQSLLDNTTGANNVALGYQALEANTTASNNTAVGYQAGYTNSTGDVNVFVGNEAGLSNTTASSITAVGSVALRSNTTSVSNSAFGRAVGYSNTTGGRNSAFGGPADTNIATFQNNTTGSYNSAFGHGALASNTTASSNTAVGYQAGYNNTTGIENTFVGRSAGVDVTTGTTNTFVGYDAGGNVAAPSGAVCLGRAAGYGLVATNTLYIARDNVGANSAACWIFGSSAGACSQGNNSSSWTTTSDERVKNVIGSSTKGLAEIMQVEVKNFKYKTAEEMPDFVKNEQGNAVINPDSEIVYTGAIAQQVQAPFPECVKAGDQGVLSVDSDPIFWAMLKAIQELKAEFDAYKATHP